MKVCGRAGIRVLAVLAGATNTGVWNQLWGNAPRDQMIPPETVAEAILHALMVPAEATIEHIRIGPAGGAL